MSRVSCCVPSCRRTTDYGRLTKGVTDPATVEHWQWICPTHWALVPRDMKRVYARLRRREKRFGVQLDTARQIWRRIQMEVGARPRWGYRR